MTITQCVDRGLQLRKEIKEREAELKLIQLKLENYALKAPQTDLKDQDREGRRWLARGSQVLIPVILTADKIVGSFKDGSPVHGTIKSALPRPLMENFFTLTRTWENRFDDGKAFRKAADETFGKEAPPFITACLARDKHGIPKSDIKIAWDKPEEAA